MKELLCVIEEKNIGDVSSGSQEKQKIQEMVLSSKKNLKNETLSPAVNKLIQANNLNPNDIRGTGKNRLITKEDVLKVLDSKIKEIPSSQSEKFIEEREKIVPMSPVRQAIANRLVQAQQNAAILTTFNEVDMSYVMDLRKTYKEKFKEKHNTNLGFMSFFAKSVVYALKLYPAINAEIRDNNIVYKNYFDLGIAVGSPKGLFVPIIRNADKLNFSQIEQEIVRLSLKVKNGKIELKDLQGATFTISNGGVYGSMLSTPILNPPQVGILGMHNIAKRAVVVGDEIKIRPVMYIALSYDHRLIDGKEAVSFLVSIKQTIEDPVRLLLDI